MQERLARITFSDNGWRQPSPGAKDRAGSRYVRETGFGNEEWLFRDEWEIDGWRYAFLQGVHDSRSALPQRAEAFNVTLYTINPITSEWFYIAHLTEVECLTREQSRKAALAFAQKGWTSTMRAEALVVGAPISEASFEEDPFNVRFKLSNLHRFGSSLLITLNDMVGANKKRFKRYKLFHFDASSSSPHPDSIINRQGRAGTSYVGLGHPILRDLPEGRIEVSCEHKVMQQKLLAKLKSEYPSANIKVEENSRDLTVHLDGELRIYEIKSDLNALTVFRNAIGQLLEYAYFARSETNLAIKLIVVGRSLLSREQEMFFAHLQKAIQFPLEYLQVAV